MIEAHVYRLVDNAWAELPRACYPISLSRTLDESLDSGTVTWYGRTAADKKIDPAFSKLKAVITDDDGTVDTRYHYYSDSSEQRSDIPDYPLYVHTLQLVEPTKILERYIISGMAVTQPLTGTKKTIKNVIDTLLDTNPLHLVGRPAVFQCDESLAARLSAVESPEFKWSCKMTLWECLYDIGRYLGAVPRLKENPEDDRIWNVVTWDFYDEIKNVLEELKAVARYDSFDEVQACSELETYAENLIGADEGMSSVTEPSENAWVGVRSEEIRLTEDNCFIPTQYPIYKVCRVTVKEVKLDVYEVDENGIEFPTADKIFENLDISEFVVEKNTWDTLPASFSSLNDEEVYGRLYKNNTIIFSQNERNIRNLQYKEKGSYRAIDFIIRAWVHKNTNYEPDIVFPAKNPLLEMQFRIEYIPIMPAKVTTVKTYSNEQHNALAYNQHAEVYDARALGRNMWGKVQSLGIPTSNVVEKYKHWKDIPQVGDRYQDMIVTNVNAELRSVELAVAELTLSQDFNRISEYVNVNSQYRQWAIPGDGYVERNLHYQNFVVIDSLNHESNFFHLDFVDAFHKIFKSEKTNSELNCMEFVQSYDGAVLSCQSLATGNSLIFSGRTMDNLSAGKRVEGTSGNSQSIFVSYCNADGTIDKMYIVIGNKIVSYRMGELYTNLETYRELPYMRRTTVVGERDSRNEIDYNFWSQYFQVLKDPTEQINFIYQLHIVSNLKSVVIGPLLTESNPLIKSLPNNRKFKIWDLKKPISKFTQVIDTTIAAKNEMGSFVVSSPASWGFSLTVYVNSSSKGWAITDENDRLYIAENITGQSSRTLNFNFVENRY